MGTNAYEIMRVARHRLSHERLRAALTEIRNRIKGHPAYAELTEAEENAIGGDTAEFSYLARVADAALGQLLPED